MNFDVLNFSITDAIEILKKRIHHDNCNIDCDYATLNDNFVFLTINEKDFPIDFDVKCELEEIEGIELLTEDSYIPSIDFSLGEDLALVV